MQELHAGVYQRELNSCLWQNIYWGRKFFASCYDKYSEMSEMDVNIARIRDSFSVTSVNPVTVKGTGNFMDELEYLFKSAQEKMVPAEGLPNGVYTMNGIPDQTREDLNITPLDIPPAGV